MWCVGRYVMCGVWLAELPRRCEILVGCIWTAADSCLMERLVTVVVTGWASIAGFFRASGDCCSFNWSSNPRMRRLTVRFWWQFTALVACTDSLAFVSWKAEFRCSLCRFSRLLISLNTGRSNCTSTCRLHKFISETRLSDSDLRISFVVVLLKASKLFCNVTLRPLMPERPRAVVCHVFLDRRQLAVYVK